MKIVLFALFSAFAISGNAADFTGYMIDQACAAKPAMKGNEACARKCMKGGSPAVLVTEEGKIYKIDNQAKVVPLAGKQVTIIGAVTGDTIKLTSVEE